MLKEKGYKIDIAVNGLEALNYFSKMNYDLILMDIQMPEMDGIEATNRIREIENKSSKKHTPVIALTSYALQGDREKFLSLGMDEYVSKPIKMDELYSVIDKIMYQSKDIIDEVEVKITDDGVLVYSENSKEKPINDCQRIYKKLSKSMEEIERALSSNNCIALEKYAKIIKELYNQLDVDELKSTAFRIELSARRGKLDETIRYSMQLLDEFEVFKKSI